MLKFLFLLLSAVLLNAAPEKMMLGTEPVSQDLGAIVISSSVERSRASDITPTIFYRKVSDLYGTKSVNLSDVSGDVSLKLMVLEPGLYKIESISFLGDELDFMSQEKLNIYFKVKKDKVSYVGRLNMSMDDAGMFAVDISNHFSDDMIKFFKDHDRNIKVGQCLMAINSSPVCKGEYYEAS